MEKPSSLDPERQRQAKAYARLNRRWMLADLGLGLVYGLAWLIPFGGENLSNRLKAALLGLTSSEWLLVALYALVFGGLYYLIDLPLSYHSGFRLPRRFGLSTETPGGWMRDQLKGLALSGALGGLLLEIVYAVLRAFPDTWWLWAAAIFLVFGVLLSSLAPVALMPLFNKFTPLGAEHQDLAERLMRLARQANTQVQGVFTFDMSRRTSAANAALAGLGRTRRIILGDTLLNDFTTDEIETVLAHELGHQVHRDIPLGIAVQTGLTLAGLYLASLGLKWGAARLGFQGPADIAALPVLMLAMSAYGLLTMPLSNAFSRWRERRADQYALQATGKPQAFASAMTRLANQNLAEVEPEPWIELLLYSHPALSKRIRMAEQYQDPSRAA